MSTYVVELTVLSDTVNSPVVHFPGRRFPGVLVQGDSLENMASLAAGIAKQIGLGDLEKAKWATQDLAEQLDCHVKLYEETLKAFGLELPYPSQAKKDG